MNEDRLKRVQRQFQQDLSEIFRQIAREHYRGLLLTPTAVRIAADFSVARILVSVFPGKNPDEIVSWLNDHRQVLKNNLVQRTEGKLRKMPELRFYLDDALDQQEQLDRIFREGGESPLQ